MIEYEVDLSADLGTVFAHFGDMLKRVNDEVASLGHDEKLVVRGRPFTCAITSEHELSDEEIVKMKEMLTNQFNESQPAWKVKIESFRRKSEQLVNQ